VHAARLPSQAFSLLSGFPQLSNAELLVELKEVSTADVHEVALEALDSALLMVPEGRRADWAGFTAAPTTSERAVEGYQHQSLESRTVRLVVGREGVSIAGQSDAVTVRYDQCAALLAWPDGRRMLVGNDSITVAVEPTMFAGAAAAIPAIDAAVRPDLRVHMPARDPKSIPQPDPEALKQKAVPTHGSPASIAGIVMLSLIVLVIGGFTALLALGLIFDPQEGEGDLWIVVAGGAALTGYIGFALVRAIQQVRRLAAGS
jgi:hypothetical protein